MASVSAITVGSQVWLEDDELAWIEGIVQQVNGTKVKVHTRKGNSVHASIQNVHLRERDVKPGGVDDMAKLAYLHEPGLLHNLACRYELDEIYLVHEHVELHVKQLTPFKRRLNTYITHSYQQVSG